MTRSYKVYLTVTDYKVMTQQYHNNTCLKRVSDRGRVSFVKLLEHKKSILYTLSVIFQYIFRMAKSACSMYTLHCKNSIDFSSAVFEENVEVLS